MSGFLEQGPLRDAAARLDQHSLGVSDHDKLDSQFARFFARAIMSHENEHWSTVRFPVESEGRSKNYLIPVYDGINILTLARPEFHERKSIEIEKFVLKHQIRELHLYDTPLSSSVCDLCIILRPHLDRLVIRDHHGGRFAASARLQALKALYPDDSLSFVLDERQTSPTGYQLVRDYPTGLLRESADAPKKLVIISPLDIDSLQSVALALGHSYKGQFADVLALEAKDRSALKNGISVSGRLILEALRIMPMVREQQGHKTFATLLIMAALQSMNSAESNDPNTVQQAKDTLSFLGEISRAVNEELVHELIVQNLVRNCMTASGDQIDYSFVDLTKSDAKLTETLVGGRRQISFSKLNFNIEVNTRQALFALLRDPDRLRMKAVLSVGSTLQREQAIPSTCLVFIRYPNGTNEPITRVAFFGDWRSDSKQSAYPFMDNQGRAFGDVKDNQELMRWLQSVGQKITDA